MKEVIVSIILILLISCIETDTIDDEIVVLSIAPVENSLSSETISGLIGTEIALMTKAQNDRGVTFSPDAEWNSTDNSVATVSENGVVRLIGQGSSIVTASAFGLISNQIILFSVNSETDLAIIEITADKTMLAVNESVALQAQAKTINDEVVENVEFSWASSNPSVAEITQQGQLTALADGMTSISAMAEGITGIITITVGDLASRAGTFTGLNGYSVSGDVTLAASGDGLALELGNNFTASSGPGLYLYLSNSRNTISGGFEIGALRKNSGSDVYEIPNTVSLQQYNHVIVYCKPFGVGFGTATLN